MGGADMEKQMIFPANRFALVPDRDEVFAWLQCDAGPCRAAFEREWVPALQMLEETMAPVAVCTQRNANALTVFLTIGMETEKRVTALFREERYILGSLLNTLCDEMLFQMDSQLANVLQRELVSEHLYMAERLEPRVHLSPETLQADFGSLQSMVPFARVTTSGVLYPAKSMLYRIVLTGESRSVSALHDCARCNQADCLYRDRKQES